MGDDSEWLKLPTEEKVVHKVSVSYVFAQLYQSAVHLMLRFRSMVASPQLMTGSQLLQAWKARLAGYEEAVKLFSTLDEKDSQFMNYLELLKKFVVDSNAIAQEKALDAVFAFVETAQVAKRYACARIRRNVVFLRSSPRIRARTSRHWVGRSGSWLRETVAGC